MVVQTPSSPPGASDLETEAGVIEDARARQRRHRIIGLVLLAAAAVAAGLIVVMGGGGGGGGGASRDRHDRPSASSGGPADGLRAAGVVDLGGVAQALLVHGATLWVATTGRVSRVVGLNLRTGQTVARIPYPGAPVNAGLTYGAGSVWLASTGDSDLLRIDPMTNRLAGKIFVGAKRKAIGGGVAFAEDRVWVSRVSNARGDVIAINPATDKPAGAPIAVGTGPDEIVAGFGSLWVNNTSVTIGHTLPGQAMTGMSRIDAQTLRAQSQPFSGIPAVGFGSLWLQSDACDDDAALLRVDPASGRTLARIPVPRVCAVASGDGRVWALSYPNSSSASTFEPIKGTAALRQIDPRTNRVIGNPRYLQALQPVAIAVSRGQLWIADYQSGKLDHFQLTRR